MAHNLVRAAAEGAEDWLRELVAILTAYIAGRLTASQAVAQQRAWSELECENVAECRCAGACGGGMEGLITHARVHSPHHWADVDTSEKAEAAVGSRGAWRGVEDFLAGTV